MKYVIRTDRGEFSDLIEGILEASRLVGRRARGGQLEAMAEQIEFLSRMTGLLFQAAIDGRQMTPEEIDEALPYPAHFEIKKDDV